MMSFLSLIVIVLFTAYSVYYTYRQREKLTCMAGMMISMTIGMMSSIGLGVILGVVLKHDLTISTLIAILFGMVAGYASGKPISLMAAMDGMMAGIMGGMMGAMLGVMLTATSNTMIFFVDIIFIFIMSVLNQLIDEETGKAKADTRLISKPFVGSMLALVVGVVFVSMLLFLQHQNIASSSYTTSPASAEALPQTTEVQSSSEGNEGYQIADIAVKSTGYGTQSVKLKSGLPTKIDFKTDQNAGCLRQVVSEELGINAILQEGDNYITLKDAKPGTYQFTCGMGMYGGTITIN